MDTPTPETRFLLLVGPLGSGTVRMARNLVEELPLIEGRVLSDLFFMLWGSQLWNFATPPRSLPPVRAPHHTVSTAGLTGSARPARPGEASLAHGGGLILANLPEFRLATLRDLGGVLRRGSTTLTPAFFESRPRGRAEWVTPRGHPYVRFPASPALVVATAAPCPCGSPHACACTPEARALYEKRLTDSLDAVADFSKWERRDLRVTDMYLGV